MTHIITSKRQRALQRRRGETVAHQHRWQAIGAEVLRVGSVPGQRYTTEDATRDPHLTFKVGQLER